MLIPSFRIQNSLCTVLVLLLLLCFKPVNAQIQWAVDGAEWHYENLNTLVWLKVVGDTVINDKTCKEIAVFEIRGKGNDRDTTVRSSEFTYAEDSVVYQLIEGKFLPNWVFKLGADAPEYVHGKSILPQACGVSDSSVYTHNGEIEYEEINGTNLLASSCNVEDQGWDISGCIERIGGNGGFLFNYYTCIIDGPSYILKCYYDPEIGLYQTSPSCDELTGIFENAGSEQLQVFPNPSSGAFKIQFKQGMAKQHMEDLHLVDVRGVSVPFKQVWASQSIHNITLGKDVPSGVYFLKHQTNTVRLVKQ